MPLRLFCTDDHEALSRLRAAHTIGTELTRKAADLAAAEAAAARAEIRDLDAKLHVLSVDAVELAHLRDQNEKLKAEILSLKALLPSAPGPGTAAAPAPSEAPSPVLRPARTSRVKTAATEKDGKAG